MPQTLHDWFSRTAAQHGDRPALRTGTTTFTYRQLSTLTAHLASQVGASHSEVPQRIGLMAHRSPATYAAYLAIQQLGATAVPLSPSAPAQRNHRIAQRAGLTVILTDGTEAGGAPDAADEGLGDGQDTALPTLLLDTTPPESAAVPEVGGRRAAPDDVAYILFTSGSTGTPKGVQVTHRNASTYIAHVIDRYRPGPGSRLSQTFDLTFDLSVFDMFAAWGSGATLVVPSRQDLQAPIRWAAQQELTHWFSVPSMVSLACRMRALPPGALPSLRWSLFCGEPLTLQQARNWADAAPGSTLANLYGPTELTISCSEYVLPRDPAHWPHTENDTVPIGILNPGLEHLVLDEGGSPAEVGELVVRGPQRFPGYLDPHDNTGRFVTFTDGHGHPTREGEALTGEHWYRTGDRVRWNDSVLVHQGRLDHQVKINGHRVELGEIEAALRRCEGVSDALVLALPGRGEELELHAACSGSARSEDLARKLRRLLPPYMLPRTIAVRPELPLNSNGKIDRRAVATTLLERRSAPRPRVRN
ncbi:amino acid adenylation domain-containing protein [Streptomyces sp. AM 4-1-1]|uniref:amino acid adenylation domain-containing protein n=1 Tax=Streptomyces sp. AM 4-1-1 TaxID=3028710 RepID=UPI0023B8C52A|nr:amino acid adenylation domain-containing protein [Streptomyces sp. AM 4-1-1]WEH37235.1 amino acid adenylation domain-containing protein [Streptomyces sp. AM 4-1-1]